MIDMGTATAYLTMDASKFMSALSDSISKLSDFSRKSAEVMVGLGKQSIESFAQFEQLVGGVETLFKDSAAIVQDYAANAYKTAGLSANEYMDTVTSFSASLLQSLDGDTVKAAEKANKAITDMSDNANKMGTAMSSIQKAYQGFAKQNFTMLDNLKLGYGGTKKEMERLLKDAEELSGIKYDLNSYSDIVDAIHVIQTEMGITGTTAEEAEKTISGSLAAARSAWANLVTGVADENAKFDDLIDNFVSSVSTAADNLLPRIEIAINGMGKLVQGLAPKIGEELPLLVNEVVPSLAQAASDMIGTLADNLANSVPLLSDTASGLIDTLVNTISDVFPKVIDVGLELINSLAVSVTENSDKIINMAFDIVDTLVNALIENSYKVIDGAVSLITSLVDGLSERSPAIVAASAEVVKQLIIGITDNTGELVGAALELIMALGAGLIEALPVLAETAVEIPQSIADSLIHYDWSTAATKTMTGIANALDDAQKHVQVALDNIFSGGSLYGGDVNNVDSTDFVNNMRDGIDDVGNAIKAGSEWLADQYDMGRNDIAEAQESYTQTLSKGSDKMANEYMKRGKESEKSIKALFAGISAVVSDGIEEAEKVYNEATEEQINLLNEHMDELEKQYKRREITEEEYNRKRLEYLESHPYKENDKWVKYYDQVKTWYEKLADTEQKESDKAAKERQKSFDKMISDYESAQQKVQSRIDTFADKLTGTYKDFYTITTKGDEYKRQVKVYEDGIDALKEQEEKLEKMYGKNSIVIEKKKEEIKAAQKELEAFKKSHDSTADSEIIDVKTTNKMKQQRKELEEYYNALEEFSKRDVGKSMLAELKGLSQEEGKALLDYWNSLPDEQVKALEKNYAKVEEISAKISEKLYSDETQNAVDNIKTKMVDYVSESDEFKDVGAKMLEGISAGLQENSSKFYEAFGKLISPITEISNKTISSIGDSLGGADVMYSDVIASSLNKGGKKTSPMSSESSYFSSVSKNDIKEAIKEAMPGALREALPSGNVVMEIDGRQFAIITRKQLNALTAESGSMNLKV